MTTEPTTGSPAWVRAVADRIRSRCGPPGTDAHGPVWVDGGVHDDGRLVVLHRAGAGAPVVGWVRDIRSWPALFVTGAGPVRDPEEFADLLWVDQLEGPSALRDDVPSTGLADRWTPPGTRVHWDLDRPAPGPDSGVGDETQLGR